MDALTTPHKTLFLSYSRKQTDWCNDFYTAIDTYTDFQRWRDNKIPESADWWHSICENIEGCFAFVAILTPDYLRSIYCMGELRYAIWLKKPIIAFKLGDVRYPKKLDEMRLQFAQVQGLDMYQTTNKLLKATNAITIAYTRGDHSTSIAPRPKDKRPPVPMPKTMPKPAPTIKPIARQPIPVEKLPEEDQILSQQITHVAQHGHLTTQDLLHRYEQERERNVTLARDLLDKIKARDDVPFFFDVDEEYQELEAIEERQAEAERQRQEIKRQQELARQRQQAMQKAYGELAHYTKAASKSQARKACLRFKRKYPDFGDPKGIIRQFTSVKAILPAPFDWIEIPGGHGTMKTNDSIVTLQIPKETYWMSKYPVTNAQFAKFIEVGGYKTKRWWTEEGWHYRNDENWEQPRYWEDGKWNGAKQPVVGVSWFEAVAFCLWLSEVTSENIMLPTEAQWQYAAQGMDGRTYPWGDEFDKNRCNTEESSIGKTTPVMQYAGKGDSLFGVVDMAGNVWEWCLTDYNNLTNNVNDKNARRVLRGGGFYNPSIIVRGANRFDNDPDFDFDNVGFRCVRPPSR